MRHLKYVIFLQTFKIYCIGWNLTMPSSTTSQYISTTTHHHPLPTKIYPPLTSTTQKMDHRPAKAKIYSKIASFWHFFFLQNTIFLYVTEILWDNVLISSFFKFKISTTFCSFFKFKISTTFYDIQDFLKFIFQEFKVTRFIFVCLYE